MWFGTEVAVCRSYQLIYLDNFARVRVHVKSARHGNQNLVNSRGFMAASFTATNYYRSAHPDWWPLSSAE